MEVEEWWWMRASGRVSLEVFRILTIGEILVQGLANFIKGPYRSQK